MVLKRYRDSSNVPSPNKKIKLVADVHDYTISNPSEFLVKVFKQNGMSPANIASSASSKFIRPTPQMVQAYTMEASMTVRDNDLLEKLKELYALGVTLESCNRFESLVHIACRRGHTRMVKFLVKEVKVSVHIADDMNRLPLHDACWASKPNFEIVELLLREAPEHALCADKRGHTPFDFTRNPDWTEWVSFLFEHGSLFQSMAAASVKQEA
jgi:ankyrin repeat protein